MPFIIQIVISLIFFPGLDSIIEHIFLFNKVKYILYILEKNLKLHKLAITNCNLKKPPSEMHYHQTSRFVKNLEHK